MENQEKLLRLEKEITFLEEELESKRSLHEALHPGVSYSFWKEVGDQIESINRSIGYKRRNIDEITA